MSEWLHYIFHSTWYILIYVVPLDIFIRMCREARAEKAAAWQTLEWRWKWSQCTARAILLWRIHTLIHFNMFIRVHFLKCMIYIYLISKSVHSTRHPPLGIHMLIHLCSYAYTLSAWFTQCLISKSLHARHASTICRNTYQSRGVGLIQQWL